MDRSRTNRFVTNRVYRGIARFVSGCYQRRRLLGLMAVGIVSVPIVPFVVCWFLFPFPWEKLGHGDSSILVLDRSGRTLLELVGKDDQRRRPIPLSAMSPWLTKAVVAVEDERFEEHFGVDPVAITRAVGQNLQARRTVSGASTISMQVCKMIDDRPRTWHAKIVESFRALQLESGWSKSQILEEYLNQIPCGGNLRGVEVASQVYFGKSAARLSLGEAALLVGLPQSPNRYAPDRHPEAAGRRRETVLRRMLETGQITMAQHAEAMQEPIVVGTRTVPTPIATHAVWMALAQNAAGGRTTIDLDLQQEVESLVHDHATTLPPGADVAVVVLDVEANEIMALVGSANEHDPRDGQVNGVLALRSPGSALKPILYAAAFEARRLSPESMVDDVPIERAGWTPENFDRTHQGAMTAAEALRQSLNVPAITITEGLGLPRCLGLLESVGVKLPADAESRGGLAVATGGLEVTLLDLTNASATLAREGVCCTPSLLLDHPGDDRDSAGRGVRVLDHNVCRAISTILSSEHRCPRGFESVPHESRPVFCWKTGTSSGRRDAWAIGHNGRYAIGVWVGNFHGAGHQEFVGRDAAEPLLSRLFNIKTVRTNTPLPTYQQWTVDRPLPRPVEATGELLILSPRNDSAFLAWNGSAIIHPRVTGGEQITWFHNGRALADEESLRLIIARGSHELRAVAATGQSAMVRFTVK